MDIFLPPFAKIPMPLDAEGRGPETDPKKVVRTVYQVWDSAFVTAAESDYPHVADMIVHMLNESYTRKK